MSFSPGDRHVGMLPIIYSYSMLHTTTVKFISEVYMGFKCLLNLWRLLQCCFTCCCR